MSSSSSYLNRFDEEIPRKETFKQSNITRLLFGTIYGKMFFSKEITIKDGTLENFSFTQRRSTKRVKLKEPVRFQFKNPELYGTCLSCDVSEGGIKMNLNQFIPIKEELDLLIRLKDEKAIDCRAKVVWIERLRYSERYRAGLEFVRTGDYFNSKKEINAIVKFAKG